MACAAIYLHLPKMIKTLQTSRVDLWLREQDHMLRKKTRKKYDTLKANYRQCLRFFTKTLLLTNFPFKAGLDYEIKRLSKEIYNLQKCLQFTSSLRIVGCKNYQILKKRNRLIQIVFTL